MTIAVSSRLTPDVTASPARDRADPARPGAPKAPRPASAMGEFIRVSRRILSATRLAVSGVGGSTVWFPTTSSPSNRMVDHAPAEGGLSGHEEVFTTSVAEIVDTHGDVDLLKLDCEGAEYDIVAATKPDAWSRIRAVCIEYHKGRTEALIAPLVSAGFHLKHHARDARWPDDIGMLHFARG